MSNTGKGKKLAFFNCDQQMWSQFIARCQSQDTTATAMLTNFIGLYLDDSLNDPDPIADDDLEKNLLDSQLQKLQSASAKVRDVY